MNLDNDTVEIRPMVLEDLKDVYVIDRQIRAAGEAITYADVATADIFAIDRDADQHKRPLSYIVGLLDLGFVAVINECISGYILGQIEHVGEKNEIASILIMGVHSDYKRQGIASKLVEAICDKFHSQGITKIFLTIDQRDSELIDFAEHLGFAADHRIDYTKTL